METPHGPVGVMGTAGAVARLVRPLNGIMMAAGVGVGSILASPEGNAVWTALLPMLAAVAIGGAGNVINDLYDVEIDRINRPERPLPSGLLSARTARLTAGTLLLVGMVAAGLASALHLILAFCIAGLLWLYSAHLKRIPVAGNAAVAVSVAAAPVFGALSWHPGPAVFFAAAFAFLTTLAREITKDVEDIDGDSRNAVRTLALAAGPWPARLAACSFLAAAVLLTPLPYLRFGFSGSYLALVFTANLLLLLALHGLMKEANHHRAARAGSRLLKAAMAMGLIALALADPSGSGL